MMAKSMSKQTKTSYYFPEEIILQILHKLPVKSLGRCLCVCKTWLSLIKTPSFISAHLNISSNSNTGLFVVTIWKPDGIHYSLQADNQGFGEYTQLKYLQFDGNHSFVGSCNGLLCLARRQPVSWKRHSREFIVWNPVIEKYIKLPNPNWDVCPPPELSVGFGYDSVRDDYKVLRITPDGVDLYSLKKNRWETIAPRNCDLYRSTEYAMVFVNGVVHCVAYEYVEHEGNKFWGRELWVLGFDLSNEIFKRFMLPESLRILPLQTKMRVTEHASSIAVIVEAEDSTQIWVMKEYGLTETWAKILSIEAAGAFSSTLHFMGFRKNGQLIINKTPLYDEEQVLSQALAGKDGSGLDVAPGPSLPALGFAQRSSTASKALAMGCSVYRGVYLLLGRDDSENSSYGIRGQGFEDRIAIGVDLYSLKKNKWEKIAPPNSDFYRDGIVGYAMVFVNGVVHCVAYEYVQQGKEFWVMGFDLSNKIFKRFMLPESLRILPRETDMHVTEHGSSIAVIVEVEGSTQIWVMKEYGVIETWAKIWSIEGGTLDPTLQFMGFRKNGQLIISKTDRLSEEEQVVLYNLSSNETNKDVGVILRRIFVHILSIVKIIIMWRGLYYLTSNTGIFLVPISKYSEGPGYFDVKVDNFLDYFLQVDNNQESGEYTQLKYIRFDKYAFVGSCNGLHCLRENPESDSFECELIIWNPTIEKYIRLPAPSYRDRDVCRFTRRFSIGFGYDSVRDDYKVLRITRSLENGIAVHHLYSLKKNQWERIAPPPDFVRSPNERAMVFVNGVVHCIASSSDYVEQGMEFWVLGFDLSNETFKTFVLPESLRTSRPTDHMLVKEHGSSIAVIKVDSTTVEDTYFLSIGIVRTQIWVMKEYGVVETWAKILTIEGRPSDPTLQFMGFGKNGQLIISNKTNNSLCDEEEQMLHIPIKHLLPLSPALLQPPQCFLWDIGLTHFPLQQISEYLHFLPHIPQLLQWVAMFSEGSTEERIQIWNPVIEKYIKLPTPNWDDCAPPEFLVGFGYDSVRDDYKILRITDQGRVLGKRIAIGGVELYSLKKNQWETIAPPNSDFYRDIHGSIEKAMVFANGVFHCTVACKNVEQGREFWVLGFDLSHKIFKRFMLPEGLRVLPLQTENYMRVTEHGSSIAVIAVEVENAASPKMWCRTEIWVMKEHGVIETWAKIWSIEGGALDPTLLFKGFRKNGQQLIISERSIYDEQVWDSMSIIEITNVGVLNGRFFYPFDHQNYYNYVQSLVLLDQVGTLARDASCLSCKGCF
ncbi:hypothetical protein CCACVL1_15374 [Corchorus capsularis]|uniref:F-box domain-containing protein n=1 Tax=Corchorus capsularis TaxID=210143 RepID=A0A1R3I2U0_COCAP|nr:hypothetical protein CCACVL1_15374 [Corchorus capsularis]